MMFYIFAVEIFKNLVLNISRPAYNMLERSISHIYAVTLGAPMVTVFLCTWWDKGGRADLTSPHFPFSKAHKNPAPLMILQCV